MHITQLIKTKMENQITNNEIRRFLGDEHQELSDKEIERISNQVYELTYCLFEIWKKQEFLKEKFSQEIKKE